MHKQHYVIVLCLFSLIFPALAIAATVKPGAEVLRDSGFALLQGMKYGLVTNQTACVEDKHLLDLMIASGVPPSVIFVPEHGLKGNHEDGVQIKDGVESGIPVRSLYGGTKKPREEDLADLNLLIFDIQNVGARFYTYISTMGLVMQAAAEACIPLIILDRPNPLGGDYVAGFISHISPAPFTALYPIPVAHGMTIGELAMMIKGEALLPDLQDLELSVVKMSGWERWMRWPDTGLRWTPTSPNIPDFETALLYAGVGLLEGSSASEGRGTDRPFRLVGLPNIDSTQVMKSLNEEWLPGVEFKETRFNPRSIPGRASDPKYKGREVSGISISVTDYDSLLPVETGVAIVRALYHAVPEKSRSTFFRGGMTSLAGSLEFRKAIEQGKDADDIATLWDNEVQQFLIRREPYLLY